MALQVGLAYEAETGGQYSSEFIRLEVEDPGDGRVYSLRCAASSETAVACDNIVNMSSLAGKAGPAYQEPYAATKAGLIEFTMSLRETYFRSGVSASVICPGFVEAGIYARLKEKSGCSAPALLGTSRPETVGKAIERAIQKDIPQIIINPYPVRPIFALTQISPRLGSWLARSLGANEFFKRVYETQK
jgi:short-subunit dehydrogenase